MGTGRGSAAIDRERLRRPPGQAHRSSGPDSPHGRAGITRAGQLDRHTARRLALSRLRLRISMSLDGFVAGPNQSVENPLGIGGERLHDWVVPLAVWRSAHGLAGRATDASSAVVEETRAGIGATI